MGHEPARTVPTGPVLDEADWRARRRAHAARVDEWTTAWRARKQQGDAHPVEDFLFTYYPTRPSTLRRWHPGIAVALAGETGDVPELATAPYVTSRSGTRRVRLLDPSLIAGRLRTARFVDALLTAEQQRPARFGCHGLHEWAMVHGRQQHEVRHAGWPLRLDPGRIAGTVQELGLRCTHYDAFRFFTDSAAPLNEVQLTRADQVSSEQAGCLHATMDLYKWAAKLSPVVGSDLVADCFALAREVRALDMQAAPYDLRALGYQPIPVETAAGRADFVSQQRAFSVRAEPLRCRLLADVRTFLAAVG